MVQRRRRCSAADERSRRRRRESIDCRYGGENKNRDGDDDSHVAAMVGTVSFDDLRIYEPKVSLVDFDEKEKDDDLPVRRGVSGGRKKKNNEI